MIESMTRGLRAPAFLGGAPFNDPPPDPPTPDDLARQRWHDDGGSPHPAEECD